MLTRGRTIGIVISFEVRDALNSMRKIRNIEGHSAKVESYDDVLRRLLKIK